MLDEHSSVRSNYKDLSVQSLEAELTGLARHLNAGNCRFLRLFAKFERREGIQV